MKKDRGFTLVELLVSMALLSFVIMLSAVLFDRAIQGTPMLKNTLKNQSDSMSNIEKSILMTREIYRYYETSLPDRKDKEKPKDFDLVVGDNNEKGEPITLDLGQKLVITNSSGNKIGETSKVKGYLISVPYKNSKIVNYNNASINDELVTFVSLGHKLSETSSISKLYINENKRFIYFHKNHSNINLNFQYEIDKKNQGNFEKIRLRFLKSPINTNGSIYSVYDDGYSNNPHTSTLTQDLFDLHEIEQDSENFNGDISYKIPGYSVNSKEYLNAIDRDYAATGVTFNINGRVGITNTTFNNSEENKQNVVHLIGLPKIDALIAHYDANLVLSKSIAEKNKYYSLFDTINKDKTMFANNLKELNSNEYSFSWDNKDIRDFLGIGSKTTNEIVVPNALLKKETISGIEGSTTSLPNYRKHYGNTLYYKMDELSNSVKLNTSNDFTFFVKYNSLNYNQQYNSDNSSKAYAYTLLSQNIDVKTGLQIDNKKPAFALYVEPSGQLRLYSVMENGTKMVSEDITLFDMNSAGIYKNSDKCKFEDLEYGNYVKDKRDGREDFNIICMTKDNNGFDIYVLTRDMNIDNLKTDLYKTRIQIENIDYSGDLYFGTGIERLLDLKTGKFTEFLDINKEPVMEISDMVMYSNKFLEDDIKTTMNYLYRKYLTDKERTEKKFDENIKAIY